MFLSYGYSGVKLKTLSSLLNNSTLGTYHFARRWPKGSELWERVESGRVSSVALLGSVLAIMSSRKKSLELNAEGYLDPFLTLEPDDDTFTGRKDV